MIISMQDLLSDDQAITASAASTNYIDRGAMGTPPATGVIAPVSIYNDFGGGRPLPLLFQVTGEAFATLTSLKVALQGDSSSGFGSAVTIIESGAIAAASLIVGYRFAPMVVPMNCPHRYIRAYYTVAGSNATAGKITACVGTEMGDVQEAAGYRT
jgi:hypothetical protein